MASTVPGVRFVRCPKCLKVLTEFADVPVYKCGGCGTILRAKNRISGGQNVTLGSVGNTSQNLPDSGFLNYGLSCSGKDMVSISSELESEREKPVPVNIQSSCPNDLIDVHEKVESSEHEENRTEERSLDQHTPQPTDLLGPETNDKNIEVDKTSKLCQQGRESLKLSHRMEDSIESTDLYTSSEEDTAGGVYDNKHGNILRSTTRNSRAYDASVSSADDGCNDHVCNNHPILPESGFTQKKALDSIDAEGKEAEEDDSEERKMVADIGAKLQVQDFPTKASNEMLGSAVLDQFDSNIDEFSSKHKIHARKWETSLDSEDFHSVQNTLEPDNGGSLRMSRGTFSHDDSLSHPYGSSSAKLKSFKRAGMKILRKVDELREELSELLDKAVEGKGRPPFRGTLQESITKSLNTNLAHHPPKVYEPRILVPRQNRSSQIPLPKRPPCSCLHGHHEDHEISVELPHNICGHNGLCRACAHDIPCQSSKAVYPGLHMYSSLSSCGHKAKAPNVKSEKLHSKEKRQPVKQYCRPVFGGAPFVICYSCLKLLKLPVDFSTSRKRLHKLQCGACSEVLLFSYRARPYTIPCTPTEARHPPSEVDKGTETSTVNEISASHFNDCYRGDPISYSEEYGLSFGMSYSAEVEPALHVSRNSSDMMEGRDGMRGTGLRLHRLMGYPSASEILHQPFDVDDECKSLEPTMHCHRPEEEHVRVDLKGKGICISDDSSTGICKCMGNMCCQRD
uniref:Protein ENHANCED DISEASE RESISTANCE 4 isoform X1 n=1 Tax=Elaeis guineensis var. tenera TaxID=51953 RepID=A0A6I9R686_ELAGV|nr:protein ENHANCED DISEASE RESISTANCE 4 isoform X1 [Elaeis guineensis]